MPTSVTTVARDILIAGGGAINVADVGTTAPIDSISAYGAGWQDMGLAAESGIKLHIAKTMLEVFSWGSGYPTRRSVLRRDATAAFSLQQWNKSTLPFAMDLTQTTAIAGGVGTLTNRVLTSNVVTLTTSAAHGYGVGQTVVVAGLTGGDAFLNGTYVITAVGSATTFSFALTHADVSTGATTGSGTSTVGAVYKLTAPGLSLIEHGLGLDWVDGTKQFRMIIPKGMVQDNVDTELTRTKEAELPLTFGATNTDAGVPFTILTQDGPAFS